MNACKGWNKLLKNQYTKGQSCKIGYIMLLSITRNCVLGKSFNIHVVSSRVTLVRAYNKDFSSGGICILGARCALGFVEFNMDVLLCDDLIMLQWLPWHLVWVGNQLLMWQMFIILSSGIEEQVSARGQERGTGHDEGARGRGTPQRGTESPRGPHALPYQTR